jgi:hypothetical protein
MPRPWAAIIVVVHRHPRSFMKRRIPLYRSLFAAALLAAPASVSARVWTNAKDSSRTFEGELVKVEGDSITVKLPNGKLLTFKKDTVSAADQTFATENADKVKPAKSEEKPAAGKSEEKKPDPAPKAQNEVAKQLKGRLVKLKDGKFEKYEFDAGKEPQYYLVYFSAKW